MSKWISSSEEIPNFIKNEVQQTDGVGCWKIHNTRMMTSHSFSAYRDEVSSLSDKTKSSASNHKNDGYDVFDH
jgi:hypothetical protein